MNSTTRFLVGMALGAASMYWLDRTNGRRRRVFFRDRLLSGMAHFDDAVGVAVRDLKHRTRGIGARALAAMESADVTDEVLAERVRASLGRAVSHPGAIEVAVQSGRVILSGPVLTHEHNRLVRVVKSVRGVTEVQDDLAVHDKPGHVPALQGAGSQRRPTRFDVMQENWAPATRLLMGTAGSALVLSGMRRGGVVGLLGAAGGAALLARSVTNMPLKRLAGATGRRAIDVHKTIRVYAGVEQVFATLSQYTSFPQFMRNVREVRLHEDGRRSHWKVAGPAGATVEWDAETTAFEPNRLLAWRTMPNSIVEHTGVIRFEPTEFGTRLDIQMSYNPPAGALGHVVARLFGKDLKTEMDEDLMRLKSFLETGVPPRDAAARSAGESGSPELTH